MDVHAHVHMHSLPAVSSLSPNPTLVVSVVCNCGIGCVCVCVRERSSLGLCSAYKLKISSLDEISFRWFLLVKSVIIFPCKHKVFLEAAIVHKSSA